MSVSGRRVFHSCDEGKGVSHAGACGSKNVGTSNRKQGENPCRRKTKVSFATMIDEGLVGPKGMTKVGLDGQMVNIPSLLVYSMWGRRVVHDAHYWICVRGLSVASRKIRKQPQGTCEISGNGRVRPVKYHGARCRENPLRLLH